MTKDQAEMLTALAIAARPHGARRWDAPGVMSALGKVAHLDLAEVIKAIGRAAGERDLETPAAIGNTAALCWTERRVERFEPEKTTPETRCGICGKSRALCATAPRFGGDDHSFEPDFKIRTGGAVDELRDIKAKAATTELEPAAEPQPTSNEEAS
ncbi:hypothetical protein [Nocardioides sp. URHA0032]|uniref:hypothetical protein n=1 Tax=Nocardioides sp. URHA0032 TaxID=1380388 RepID=UPI001E48FB7F|nr:hypothetical protein [Nocardioides sp. URHA0032]